MIPLVIGNLRHIVAYAHQTGLTKGTYVPVYVRTAHEALRGREATEVEIVYVEGADLVLDQPGVRTYVGALIGLGASEWVAGG